MILSTQKYNLLSSEAKKLRNSQVQRLQLLLSTNPSQEEIERFLRLCLREGTKDISIVRRIQNSQLHAALRLMASNTLKRISGMH